MVTVGLDEVGRGCWAGPLVAAAVALADDFTLWEDSPPKGVVTGLRDSKKLSRKQREYLDRQIRSHVKAIGVGWVTPGEVDSLGLTKSVQVAMLRAMKELHATSTLYDQIIIDGNLNFFKNVEGLATGDIETIVKADDIVPAVSAASIVAKVARDNYMVNLAKKYPHYGFEKHVGYGTAQHLHALLEFGITSEHRKTFRPVAGVKKIFD